MIINQSEFVLKSSKIIPEATKTASALPESAVGMHPFRFVIDQLSKGDAQYQLRKNKLVV